MGNGYIIGVDIGGTNIRIGAAREGGTLEAFVKTSSQAILAGERAVEHLINFLRNYMRKELKSQEIECVVLGLPSTLNAARDRVIQTPNIEGLNDVPLKKLLEEALHIPVLIERDVNLLFCNDADRLSLDPAGINIGVYVGTGIGNAIFIDGLPYAGADGTAGELGHVYIWRKGKVCGCGNEGCAECYAGGKRLVELRDEAWPTDEIGKLFRDHGEDAAMIDFVDTVAAMVSMEVNILNPGAIVLGGGVLNMESFPREQLIEAIHRHTRKPFPEKTLRVYFSEDASENGVRGAIIYARIKNKAKRSVA